MVNLDFEEVWQKIRKLENQPPFTTLSEAHGRLNRIVGSTPTQLIRQTEKSDGTGWKNAKPVPRSAFENLWNRLHANNFVQLSDVKGYKYVVAACLVSVPDLGVVKATDRPLTIKLGSASTADAPNSNDDEDMEELGDRERIVLDPNICSGKPTIRGTRIMVNNILGMFAGGYSFNKILKAYPELSPLDVISAVEYASWVVDREPGVA